MVGGDAENFGRNNVWIIQPKSCRNCLRRQHYSEYPIRSNVKQSSAVTAMHWWAVMPYIILVDDNSNKVCLQMA